VLTIYEVAIASLLSNKVYGESTISLLMSWFREYSYSHATDMNDMC